MKLSRLLILSVLTLFAAFLTPSIAQNEITVEDIWKNYKFSTKSVPGFNFMKDGRHYSRLSENIIKSYDLITGDFKEDILNGTGIKDQEGFMGKIRSYSFSEDEQSILIKSESESIYRRSSKAKFHVYNRKTKKLVAVNKEGKISNASFSPDAKKIAFTQDNNMYVFDISSGKTKAISTDGVKNQIINGMCDWVYEEEFSFTKAFQWSADSKKIAYIRFDEREVPEFTMTQHHDELYPEYVTFKYPKVGEKNARVSVLIYNVDKAKTVTANLGDMTEMYIPRIKWTQDKNSLCVFKMNRHQNELELYSVNGKNGKATRFLHEKNKYYIDITDDLTFLEDGKHFIWTSEKSGFNHIYLYDMNGKEQAAITKGKFDVSNFYGIDELKNKVYYQSFNEGTNQKHIYESDLKGGRSRLLTKERGTNNAQFSGTFDYYVNTHSTINTPNTYTVYKNNGKLLRVIEDNEDARKLQKDYSVQPMEFFSFETSEKVKLNGWMLKPPGFKENGNYPVFMTQYSGPGSQSVTDAWKGTNYWWYQMLAQQGYVVACVDGRGTGGRGEEFKKMTYLQLGHYETIDQIEAAKYLGQLGYTDANRIGIFGWSYGGYMSSLCLLKGNDVFKAAIAVAPVTSWKWYDTVYTERYMRTLTENEAGYRDNSPIYFTDRLKGNYLLVHGDGDDNVHFQHTIEMTSALISSNKQYDTYFYPNRNHGIYGDNARLHLYTKMTNFLNNKLKSGDWGFLSEESENSRP